MKAYDGQRQVAELIYIGSDVYFMFPGSDINHILLLAFLHLVTAFYHLSLFCIHRIIKRIQTAVAYKFHRSGNGEFQRQQVFPLIKRKLHKIGRASCREMGETYVVAVEYKRTERP